MGVQAVFIAYYDDDPKKTLAANPTLDRRASMELAQRLFPNVVLTDEADADLAFVSPQEGMIQAGAYGGLRIVSHSELAGDYPSALDARWLDPSLGRNAYLHATHSVVDWFAFGLWQGGKLIRSLSISANDGVLEQNGQPLDFEKAYWNGDFPAGDGEEGDDYPLPFHPLDLQEASMLHHLGFQYEGDPND